MEGNYENSKDEVYSERVKAGKRTYFFDIKKTKSGDYYLVLSESKRKTNAEGDGFFYEKHKVFLYKEDFNKFMEGLNKTMNYAKNELMPGVDFDQFDREREGRRSEIESQGSGSSGADSSFKWD